MSHVLLVHLPCLPPYVDFLTLYFTSVALSVKYYHELVHIGVTQNLVFLKKTLKGAFGLHNTQRGVTKHRYAMTWG